MSNSLSMNTIFVFVVSGLLAKIMSRIKIGSEDPISLWSWIFKNVYHSWLPSKLASFTMAVTLIVLFGLILRWLYQERFSSKSDLPPNPDCKGFELKYPRLFPHGY